MERGLERRQDGSERERKTAKRRAARGVGNGALHLLAQTEGGRAVQYVQGSGESSIPSLLSRERGRIAD